MSDPPKKTLISLQSLLQLQSTNAPAQTHEEPEESAEDPSAQQNFTEAVETVMEDHEAKSELPGDVGEKVGTVNEEENKEEEEEEAKEVSVLQDY